MEKAIRQRYTDDIFEQARRRYGISENQVTLLDGFESYIYEYHKGNREYILRLGHSRRRTVSQIRGEVDWINYLAAGGAGVAKAILSEHGNLIELIADGVDGHFLATAFVKAAGKPPWEYGFWQDDSLLERYGRLVGRMHRLSKKYQPPDPAWRRPEWDDPNSLDLANWLPASETAALEKFQHLMQHLRSLPKDEETYGLIHQDAHAGNFFVDDQGHLTLFDFDDCAYGWYAYDLAMVLFYAVTNRDDVNEFGPHFWRRFMQGYQQESSLDEVWLGEIPHFMKLRELDVYAILHRSKDPAGLDPNGWDGRFMAGRRDRILNDVPCIEFQLVLP